MPTARFKVPGGGQAARRGRRMKGSQMSARRLGGFWLHRPSLAGGDFKTHHFVEAETPRRGPLGVALFGEQASFAPQPAWSERS